MQTISDREFLKIRNLVYDRFGINLTEEKRSLVVGRLQKILADRGFDSHETYCRFLVEDKTNQGLSELVNEISTNFSYFYRESAHFDFFVNHALPMTVSRLQSEGSRDIRIWSAGCSTGEEPYTLVMMMMEYFGANYSSWETGVLSTDISQKVLDVARRATYPADRIKGVPKVMRTKYFKSNGSGVVEVHEGLKSQVTFRRFNLMNTDFPFRKPFHMIFCRNVMIYFDSPTREALVRKFHEFIEPGGFLFIGHSETLGRQQKLFEYVQPATYMRI